MQRQVGGLGRGDGLSKKSIKKNYIYNTAYQILAVLTPLITTPYVSRVLKAEGVGIYSYNLSIVTYFMMFAALGSSGFAQREVAYNQNRKEELNIIFWNTLLFRLVTTAAACFIYFLLLRNIHENRAVFICQTFSIVSVAFDVTWLFQGLEEFGKIVLRNVVIKAVSVLCIFAFVKEPADLPIYALIYSGFALLGNLSIWRYLPQYVSPVSLRKLHPFKDTKPILQFFLPAIAISAYTLLDKTMLGYFAPTPVENGYYEQTQKIVMIFLKIITSLSPVMIPRIAYVYAQKDYAKVNHYMYLSYRFVWMTSLPIIFGLNAMAAEFVPWFLGEGFTKCVGLIQILSFLLAIIGLSNVTGAMYLVASGRQNIYTVTVTVGCVCNICLNLFLIPRYYSAGAVISTIFAETVIVIVQFVYVIYMKRIFEFRKIIGSMWSYLLCSAIMYVAVKGFMAYSRFNFVNAAITVAIGAAVYAASLIWLVRDSYILEMARKIRTHLGKAIKR